MVNVVVTSPEAPPLMPKIDKLPRLPTGKDVCRSMNEQP